MSGFIVCVGWVVLGTAIALALAVIFSGTDDEG